MPKSERADCRSPTIQVNKWKMCAGLPLTILCERLSKIYADDIPIALRSFGVYRDMADSDNSPLEVYKADIADG